MSTLQEIKSTRLEKIFSFFLSSFLFLLPWQTVWILHEQFLNGSKWQYGTIGCYATEILLWGAIVSFIVWFIKVRNIFGSEKKEKFHSTKDRLFIFSILLFITYSLLSTFWATVPLIALGHSLFILEAFLLFIIILFGPIKWEPVVKWLVAGAVLQSVLGLWQFFTQSTVGFKWLGLVEHPVMEPGTSVLVGEEIGRVLRAYGGFSHPNVFGGYLVFSLVLTTLLLWVTKRRGLAVYIALGIQLVALFFTFSRSAWIDGLVWFVGILIYWFFYKNKSSINLKYIPRICLFVFCLGLMCSFFSWNLVANRFAHTSAHEIRSTEERISGITESLQIWKSAPLLGVGSGNYTAAAYALNPQKEGYEYQPVHNLPLLILTELGIIGIFLLGIVITLWFFVLFSLPLVHKRDSLIFCALVAVVYSTLSLFDHYLYSSYSGLIFGLGFLTLSFRFFTQVFPSLSSR